MPRGGGRPMPGMRGSMPGAGGNPQKMLRELQDMQQRMLEEQKALETEELEVSVGGGMVKITMNGHQKLTRVEIKPELLDPGEAEMLTDLLIAAVNQAVDKTQAVAGERMGALTKGMGLPPGMF